jgi:hypothetical protein
VKTIDPKQVKAMIARIAALQVYLEELDEELRKPVPGISRTRAMKFARQIESRASAVAAETRALVNQLRPSPLPGSAKPQQGYTPTDGTE